MDFSVWIDYLKGRETGIAERFAEILDRGYPVGLTSAIYQEAVQGVSPRDEFERTSEYLGSQTFYHPRDLVQSYREAALIYFRCRREGVTVRSSVDYLIARVAIEHELLLLRDDRDFESMAGVIPDLALA